MTTLRIVIRNYADFENALHEQARLFESLNPGTLVEIVSVSIHELHDQALTAGGLRDGHFDLALLVTDWPKRLPPMPFKTSAPCTLAFPSPIGPTHGRHRS